MPIVVADARHPGADRCLDSQLFIQLPRQGLFRAFTGLDLAPGELPLQGHGLIGTALTDQHLATAHNEGSGHKAQGGTGWTALGSRLNLIHPSSVIAP